MDQMDVLCPAKCDQTFATITHVMQPETC